MKKILLFLLLASLILTIPVQVMAKEPDVLVEAPSAILVEKTTGKILYEKNPDEQMKPASVTKIMTLILIMEAIENGQFGYEDTVTASAYATSMGGSQVFLKEGEQMSVDEMLKCIVIASANDACVAMAEFVSGSVDEFVYLMNEKAKELGMTLTTFKNCTGLEAEGHLTTARDISLMSRELLKYEKIKEYTTVWMDSIRGGEFGLTNTNKLIRFYPGATGLKTGYTAQSKYCISATAQKNGMELIAVVMAGETSDKRNADAKSLLNYGFSKYALYTVDNVKIDPVKVIKGKYETVTPKMQFPLKAVIEKGTEKQLKYEINICEDVAAPVEKNQKLGEVVLSLGDNQLVKTDIITIHNVQKMGMFDIFLELLNYFLII